MPTAAELHILITSSDEASARLRSIGQEVARLEKQVEGVGGRGAPAGGSWAGCSWARASPPRNRRWPACRG